MALQIIERRWCDGLKLAGSPDAEPVPRHDPETTRGTTRVFSVDGGKPRKVDLCDPCSTGPTCLNLDELRAVLDEYGEPVDAPQSGKGGKRVPSGGTGGGKSVEKIVLDQAMSGQRHGRPPEGAREHVCLWCPMDYTASGFMGHVKRHGFANTTEAFGSVCPACGREEIRAMGVHVSKHHPEFPTVNAAFIWARDNKDPYGVYAARRAAGTNVVEGLL